MAKKVTKTSSEEKKTSPFILGPRITEKSAYAAEKNTFVFNVAPDANKIQIKQAIKTLYKVTPTAVNIVVAKPRKVVFRGNRGTQSGYKKAYVTLKKGDKIEIA